MSSCFIYRSIRTRPPISDTQIGRIVNAVLGRGKTNGEVSVHLIGDKRMRRLNRQFRSMDRTTDVLAFAAQEGEGPLVSTDLGDIFISIPQIQRQARAHHMSLTEELTRMLIHGVLHLLGYDHEKRTDAKKMFTLQEQILSSIL